MHTATHEEADLWASFAASQKYFEVYSAARSGKIIVPKSSIVTPKRKKPVPKPGFKRAKKVEVSAKTVTRKRRPGRPKVEASNCRHSGCSREARTKGLCSAHYQAERRQRSTLDLP